MPAARSLSTSRRRRGLPAILTAPSEWPQEAQPPVLACGRAGSAWRLTTLTHRRRRSRQNRHCDQACGQTVHAITTGSGTKLQTGQLCSISARGTRARLRRCLWQHGERDGYAFADSTNLNAWFPGDAPRFSPSRITTRVSCGRRGCCIRSRPPSAQAPVLIVVDNVAATFAGNQNDRVMVRSYVNLWRAIARGPSRPAVLLIPTIQAFPDLPTAPAAAEIWIGATPSAPLFICATPG